MAENRKLSRDIIDRLGMGCFSLFFLTLWGPMAFALVLMPLPQFGFWGNVILTVTEELLLAATVVLLLVFIWSIATPSWVEMLFRVALKHLYWAIALGTLAIALFAACVALLKATMR